MDSRGLVIAPEYVAGVDGSLRFPDLLKIKATALRFYLLYWDRLDFPITSVVSIDSSPDVQYLQDVGVLKRSQVLGPSSGPLGAGYAVSQIAVLRSRNNDEPGLWSLAQTGSGFVIPVEESEDKRSLEVEFYQALPLPSEEVSLADILHFKERRRDELLALRVSMDALYEETISATDTPRAKTAAVNQIELTLADLHRITKEAWPSRLLGSLKVELSLKSVLGAIAGSTLGIPGAALGLAASSIRFQPQSKTIKNLPEPLKAYAYVARAESELV